MTSDEADVPRTTPSDQALRLVLYDGLASEAMGTLTAGVFLVGFAVELGASNAAIGILAAVPFLVQLTQLPAVVLVERLRTRRAICFWSAGIGRLFLLAAATAPLLEQNAGIAVLVGAIAAYQGLGAVGGCSWNSWMRDLVPPEKFGRFFGRRTAATTALAAVLAFFGGVVLDIWKRHFPEHAAFGYSCLFTISTAIGLCGVYLLSITPDQPMAPVEQHTHPIKLLSAPLRDANFRRLIVFLSVWSFAANLAAPFFTVFMLRTLGYSMTAVMLLTIASQASNLASLELWGSLIDRFSNKAVLGVSAPLFLVCMFAWLFTDLPWTRGITFYLLLGIHILMGLSTAGVALASNNIAMKLSPHRQATAYLAVRSVVTSACAAVAPIVGGYSADFFANHQLTLALTWAGEKTEMTLTFLNLHALTFFFGIAGIVGLYSLHWLSFVHETAGRSDPIVLRDLLLEARRSVLSLSSAAGLLRVVRLPMSFLRPRRGGTQRP